MSEIITRPAAGITPATPDHGSGEIGQMLKLAIEKGNVPVDALKELVAVYERLEDRRAVREFNQAFCEFKARCPPIPKTSTATIVGRTGGKFTYQYADLAQIERIVGPILSDLGLSYNWGGDDAAKPENGRIGVVCFLRHRGGHQIDAPANTTTASEAGMSPQQKETSAETHIRRRSLIKVLGLTACDPDTDAAEEPQSIERVTVDQAAHLEQLIEEAGADRKKFFAWMGAAELEECPASRYAPAVQMLEAKIRRRSK